MSIKDWVIVISCCYLAVWLYLIGTKKAREENRNRYRPCPASRSDEITLAEELEDIDDYVDEYGADEYTDGMVRRALRHFRPEYPDREYRWYSFKLMRQRTYDRMKAEYDWMQEEIQLTETQLCKMYSDDWRALYRDEVTYRERTEAENIRLRKVIDQSEDYREMYRQLVKSKEVVESEKIRLERVVEEQKNLITMLRNRVRSQDDLIGLLKDEATGQYMTAHEIKVAQPKATRNDVKPEAEGSKEPVTKVIPYNKDDREEYIITDEIVEYVEDEEDSDPTQDLMNDLEITTQTELKQVASYWMSKQGRSEVEIANKIGCKSIRQYVAGGRKILEGKNVVVQYRNSNLTTWAKWSEIIPATGADADGHTIAYDRDRDTLELLSRLCA